MTDVDAPTTVRDVYRWDHERLWRAVYAFTGSRQRADDAVTDAFAQALVREGTLRDTTGWVWRSAFELAPDGPLDDDRTRPLDGLLTRLDGLGAGDRRVLTWCHVGGWSPTEIASALGNSRWTTAWRLRRAERRFRAVVAGTPQGAGDAAACDPEALFRGFDEIVVVDRWDDVTARLDSDELVEIATRRDGRPWIAVAAIVAVVGLVAALIVTAGSSTPAEDSATGDSTALSTATIGDGRDVTIAVSDPDDGSTAGTFRLRLYESGGTTVLEYEDIDVAPVDGSEFVVIELDGRVGLTAPYAAGSIGSVQVFEGTLTTPFTVRVVLTGADDETIRSSEIVRLRPDL